MIYGTKSWNDTSIRYEQTNRVIEKFLADLKQDNQINFWLESCNVCACCCAIESVNGEFKCKLPIINNKPIISYADLLFDLIYNSTSYKKDGICDNEVMENLVNGINSISNTKASIIKGKTNQYLIECMKEELKNENAIVLSYFTDYGSGHYICITAYNTEKDFFIGYDSWKDNKHCKNKGSMETYDSNFILERLRHLSFIKVEGNKW